MRELRRHPVSQVMWSQLRSQSSGGSKESPGAGLDRAGEGVVETTEWAGKYIPLIPVYGEEIWIENKRVWKSLIRDAKDAQMAFNYWRKTATELVALQPKAP